MKVFLSPGLFLYEIRQAFNDQFRYLRLQFYYHYPVTLNGRKMLQPVDDFMTLGELRDALREEIVIMPRQTVQELKDLFYKSLLLDVEIWQRSRNGWEPVKLPETMTLGRLNEIGRAVSHAMYEKEIL